MVSSSEMAWTALGATGSVMAMGAKRVANRASASASTTGVEGAVRQLLLATEAEDLDEAVSSQLRARAIRERGTDGIDDRSGWTS